MRRSLRGWAWVALACGTALDLGAGTAGAQAQVRDFAKPILVVNTDGHSGMVRSLAFTPDGTQLFSAGLDKVVNVWSLGAERPRLSRTIRPPLWRGLGGAIYAMTLSPVADAEGQRLLAVAGYGVDSTRGNIALYHVPGRADRPTGDLVVQLRSGDPDLPAERRAGHSDVVDCLAFSPDGRFLASGSHDASVRIWDVARRASTPLVEHRGPVYSLAFLRDGRRLLSGGSDGVLRLWDVSTRRVLARAEPEAAIAGDPEGIAINTLAVSPDDRWVVIGRENGRLIRYDAATLGNRQILPTTKEQGAVEAVAFGPDGSLATSILAHRLEKKADLPRVECVIELRRMPDGEAARPAVLTTTNLARALAFSPDGRFLAVAGGDAQAIFLKDLRDPQASLVEVKGQGQSVWDVGFDREGTVIGFARRRPDDPRNPPPYEGFDLRARRPSPVDAAALSRARTTLDDWSVKPVDLYTLDVVNAQGQGHRIALDPQLDRRWWAYSFLPRGPKHDRPAIAIACEAGVAIHRLNDGRRTRFLAGHGGAVYTLAPSPDGRFLATGSSDQTVRLWTLAGCDTLAPLGADFGPAPEAAERVVTKVERLGFAEAMGLQAGDVIEKFHIRNNVPLDPDEFLARVGTVEPNVLIHFLVRRGRETFPVGTTKRDAPALSYFPGTNGEWVLWMPRGYYDTSIAGDRRFLGWHINPPALVPPRPTDYLAIDQFEQEMRRPDLLGLLVETADLMATLSAPPPPGRAVPAIADRPPDDQVLDLRPPDVTVIEPQRPAAGGPLVVAAPILTVRVVASSEDRQPIAALRYKLGSLLLPEIQLIPPRARIEDRAVLPVGLGRQVISVIVRNVLGKERVERIEVEGQVPPMQPPRLIVLSIGIGQFAGGIPPIPFAERDAKDVGQFLAAQMVDPGSGKTFGKERVLLQDFWDAQTATTGKINAALDALDKELMAKRLGPGDVVAVVLESHVLSFDKGGLILVADTAAGNPPAPAVAAVDVADVLGRISSYGCKVVLFLDGVHARTAPNWNSDVSEWVRRLRRDKDVIVYLASHFGPSQQVLIQRHGAFAQAVLESRDVAARTGLRIVPGAPYTLEDLHEAIQQNVARLTRRGQTATYYLPEAIPVQLPILAPPTAR